MANYTEELATNIVLANMAAYRLLKDGEFYGTRVCANEGHVIYDMTDETYEPAPDTMEPVRVTYYFTQVTFPAQFDFAKFTWVAVPRSEVDENYIFGGNNDHVTA